MRQTSKRASLFYILFGVFLIGVLLFMRAVVVPVILAFVLAYVLNPFIEFFERRKVKRGAVVFGALALASIVLFVACWVLVPIVYHQFEALMGQLPQFKTYIESHWLPVLDKNLGRLMGHVKIVKFADIVPPLLDKPQDLVQNVLQNLGQSTRFLASVALTLVLSPMIAFFVMRDFKNIVRRTADLVPPDLRGRLYRYVNDVDQTLRGVLRGQILVVSLLMTLYASSFFAVGLPAGLAVGVVTGLARFVPYLDIFVGGSLCFFILATTAASSSVVFGVVIAFLSIQIFDAAFLTPRIMGRYSGIHPFLIILTIVCMGDWFGFLGVFFAVPVAAIARVTIVSLFGLYRRSKFFNETEPTEPFA